MLCAYFRDTRRGIVDNEAFKVGAEAIALALAGKSLFLSRYADIARSFFGTDQKQPPQGLWHRDRFAPAPPCDLHNLAQVTSSNPKNRRLRRNRLGAGPTQKWGELTQRPRADIVKRRDVFRHVLKPIDEYTKVCKFKIPRDFRQKRGLFDIRFDQKNMQIRPQYLDWDAGKPSTGTNVGEPTVFHRYSHGCIHALAKMTIKYLPRIANRGEIYFVVPLQQYCYILLNLLDLLVCCSNLKLRERRENGLVG